MISIKKVESKFLEPLVIEFSPEVQNLTCYITNRENQICFDLSPMKESV
jgi:hypothetical protein